jgi:hypothetical protein
MNYFWIDQRNNSSSTPHFRRHDSSIGTGSIHYSAQSSIINTDSYEELDIPTQFIFPTLPVIFHVKTSDEDPAKQIIRYMEGLSLPEVEHIIDQNPDEMESDRVFYRSALILNILMGIKIWYWI